MPPASYRTDREPCLPVHRDQRVDTVGWRELFLDAHHITDLALPLPPTSSQLLRVAAAITARLTGLDDPATPRRKWLARRADLLTAPGGFDPAAVHAYFDAHVFDLFDPERPFLQDPTLAAQCRERAGVNALIYGRPAGRNLAWLSPHTDTRPRPVPCDEALWHLLIHHGYGPSGCCAARTVGSLTRAKTQAGPLRKTVSFHPLGRTLYETLLAHLPPYRGQSRRVPDACPWELPHPPDPDRPPPPLTWPGRLLTGRTRHAALLIPDADGRHVVDAYLTWATRFPQLDTTDPYLIYHNRTDVPVGRRHIPRRADADRAAWRDLDALLLAGDESAGVQRPAVFDTLNDLPEPLRSQLRVRVHGFDQDGRINNRRWYTALTPPIWIWAQEHDAAKARRIADCRAAAEALGIVLGKATTRAWKDTARPLQDSRRGATRRQRPTPSAWTRSVMAGYWPLAETAFWQLIDDDRPPRAVFAAAAIHALRAVTAPDLIRYRPAGPALARAVATLQAAARPPDSLPPRGRARHDHT